MVDQRVVKDLRAERSGQVQQYGQQQRRQGGQVGGTESPGAAGYGGRPREYIPRAAARAMKTATGQK